MTADQPPAVAGSARSRSDDRAGDRRRLRPGVAGTIARFEVRRSIRNATDDVLQTVVLAVLTLVFLLPIGAGLTFGAYAFGGQIADGSGQVLGVGLEGLFRGGSAVAFLGVVALAAVRAATGRTDLDQPPFLLTGAPVQTVVTGQLLAEWLRLAIWLALPLAALAGAVGVGAGTPLPTLSLVVTALAVIGAGYPVGFAVGFAIRHLATVVEPIARHRLAFGMLAFLVYMGLFVTNTIGLVVAFAFRTLQDSPLGWLGDVALVGLPGQVGSLPQAVGGLLVAVGVFGVGTVANAAVAHRNWFTDPPQPEDDVAVHDGGESRLEAVLGSVARPSTTTVATTVLRRARRKPLKLVYAAYPTLLAFGLVQQVIQQGQVPAFAVVLIALYGIWAAGSLFTLNPLGDLGDAAPSTVLSGMDGAQFVRGHLLVAVPIGLVLALGMTTVAAVLSPDSLVDHAPELGLAVVGSVWAPAVAVGVGAATPRFGSVAVFRNATATLPSKRAFAVYSVGLVLALLAAATVYQPALAEVSAALLSVLLGLLLPFDVGVEATWVGWAAAVGLVFGALAPVGSYYYAARRFDRFRLS